jgi:hypothetical protein
MEDRQVPTDAEDSAGGSDARRTSRRLSDAEAVATLRRDMFGDGSLLDVLAGSPPAPAEPPEPDPASPPADGVNSPLPAPAAVEGPTPDPASTDAAFPPSLAELPQPLDAIIDSFPPEPPGADPGPTLSASTGHETIAPAGLAAAPLPVSAIFRALDAMEKREQEPQPAPDAAAPSDDPDADAPDGAEPSLADALATPAPDAAETVEASEPEPPPGQASTEQELQYLLSPPFPAGPDAPPDAEMEGVPPFPGGAGGPPYGKPSGMPQFAAPLELVVSNPEPVELPAYPEDLPPYEEPAEPLREFPDFAPYPLPNGAAGAAGTVASPPPLFSTPASPASEAAAGPMFDAAVKIAAEANATAEALENLKQLLTQSVTPETPPSMNLWGEASSFVASEPAPLLPLPVPPAETPRKGIYLLGFLTGLGLSLMAGIALYLLIALG